MATVAVLPSVALGLIRVGLLLLGSLLCLSLFFGIFLGLGLPFQLFLILHEEPLLDEDLLVRGLKRLVAGVVLGELFEPLSVKK